MPFDELTRLYDRRELFVRLQHEIARTKRTSEPFSILLIDVDHFKEVNDNFGHLRGDRTLVEIADIVRDNCREMDVACRYGGDEFVIILPETDRWKAEIAAKRLLGRIESYTFRGDEEQPDLHLTVSIGIATFPTDLGTSNSLLQRADEALYLSKSRGRNQVSKDIDVAEKVKTPALNFAGFVNRVEELSFLKTCFDSTIERKGKFVIVNGEAGVGKTRLVKELNKYMRLYKAIFLAARPFEYGVTPPYHIFFQLVRDYMQQVGAKHIKLLSDLQPVYKSTLVRFIPELRFISNSKVEPSKMAPEYEKMRLFDATYRVMEILTRKSPVVIFLDDLQWVRDTDLELFGYLLRNIGDLPLLICGAYRLEEVGDGHPLGSFLRIMSREHRYEKVELKGLSYEDTKELLRTILALQVPDDFSQRIHEETNGNPFYIEEVIKTLVDDGLVYWDRMGWAFKDIEKIKLPTSVGDLLFQRFENIDKELKDLLTQASVFGNRFHLPLLQELTRMNEGHLLDLLDLGVKKLLVNAEPDDYYSFSNLLLQRTLYENIGSIKKRRSHLRIAHALEILYAGRLSEIYENLAYHYLNGGDWEKAFDFSLKAAKKLKSLYANHESILRYKDCLDLIERKKVERNEELKSIRKDLTEIYYLTGNYDKVMDDCRALLGRGDLSAIERSEIMLLLGNSYEQKGDFDSALASYNEAQSILNKPDHNSEIAKLELHAARIYIRRGEHDTALSLVDEAIKFYEASNNLKDLNLGYNTKGLLYFNQGDWGKTLEFYRKALDCSEKVGDQFEISLALNNLGNVYHRRAEFDKAIEYHNKALKIREKIGYRYGVAGSYNNLAVIYDEIGEWDRCLDYHHRSLEISRSMNTPQTIALSYSNIGYLLYKQGEFEKAADYLLQSIEMIQNTGDVSRLANSKNNLTMAYLGMNWYDQALEILKDAEATSRKHDLKNILAENCWLQAWVFLKQGKIEDAQSHAEMAVELAKNIGDKVSEAEGYLVLSQIYRASGKIDDAIDKLVQSMDLAKALKNDFILAKGCYWYGQIMEKQGKESEAERYINESESIFKRLGAQKYYNFLTQ